MSPPQVVLGGASFGLHASSELNTAEKAREALEIFRSFGYTTIDTSRIYPSDKPGTSELILGQANLSTITVDTKVLSLPGKHRLEELQRSIDESLAKLNLPKVHILYLHMPDPKTPLMEVMKGMDAIHKQGKFDKFGISNYSIEQLREMLAICEQHNYIKPTVYQGQYNILARNIENDLLPYLRENGIAFYAWSPGAGGALNKEASTRMKSNTAMGGIIRAWYGKPAALEATNKVVDAAEKHGLTGHAVTLNWVLHHSALKGEYGDGMIFGARNVEQVRKTCEILQSGPLPKEIVKLIDEVWSEAKDSAPSYTPLNMDDEDLKKSLEARQSGK